MKYSKKMNNKDFIVDDNNKILNLKILNIDKVLSYVEKKGRNMI